MIFEKSARIIANPLVFSIFEASKQHEMKLKNTIVKCLLVFGLMMAIGSQKAEAQLMVTPGNEIEGWTADSLVRNILMSGGVTVSNVQFNGMSDELECDNIGLFQTGLLPTNLGIEAGIIIATGAVTEAVGPNNDEGLNIIPICDEYYDESLAQLASDVTNHVAVLEFDFIPWDSLLSFNYVFGSEEYPEFVDGEFNDVFAFFVDGFNPDGGSYNNTNMALIPGTSEVVSINTVNDHHNSEYYIDNTGGTTIQYDGFTVLMNVSFKVVPMTQYHIKMGICDLVDSFYDSGVFLEANSFQTLMTYGILLDEIFYQDIPEGYHFCTNHTVDFDTETSWNFDDVTWYFGDGTSAQGRHVQHTYAEDGFYEVLNVLHNPHRANDSIYISKVIEVRSQHSSEEAFTCHDEPYTWHGMQFTETGVYVDTLETTMGCDSIVTLYLTVGDFVLNDTVAEACETFTWYGQTYQASGQYEHTLQSGMGCDSIVRLNLTIHQAMETDTAATVCESFTWYGQTYQNSGQYEHTLQTLAGCDSIVTLHLTISEAIETDTAATTCGAFTWYGQAYEVSGQYEHLFETSMGCDSLVKLHLTVNQTQYGRLQGPVWVYAASDFVSAHYDYYVADSLTIEPNTLHWSCSNSDWTLTPSDNRYHCQLFVSNIGQGTLTARTEQDCDTIYSIEVNATWFDLDENGGLPVKLFPNPAQSEVTVEAEEIVRIRLFDTFGVAAIEESCERLDALTLNVSHLPSGMYMVEITTRRDRVVRKLMVTR